jgi:hypothetical protein
MVGFESEKGNARMKIFKKGLPFIIAFCSIAVITIVALRSKCLQNEIINWGLFVATISLATIAYIQLKALREQANADFLLKFNREFFGNDINQQIIVAIEENRYVLKENNGEFTAYELDDYLGYYELMSWFEKRGFIDFEIIDEMFGHYISLAWQNKEIEKYIDELRADTKDPRYYKPFEDLAKRIIERENKIREKTKPISK